MDLDPPGCKFLFFSQGSELLFPIWFCIWIWPLFCTENCHKKLKKCIRSHWWIPNDLFQAGLFNCLKNLPNFLCLKKVREKESERKNVQFWIFLVYSRYELFLTPIRNTVFFLFAWHYCGIDSLTVEAGFEPAWTLIEESGAPHLLTYTCSLPLRTKICTMQYAVHFSA